MSEPTRRPESPRFSEQPKKRSGETHPAEYHTTPQVPIQEPLDPFPGRVFGDYEILERIARGGMGVVYKARQISLNRLVALKIIPGSELVNPVERQRFRIEVEAAANIDHPRIVPIYEVGERDGYYFYSMRLIEGGSLAQRMDRYQDDHRAAARLIISAARGIHYAHQRGILHRDLKPANILLDSDGRPHVADFGVAKHLQLADLDAASGKDVGARTADPAADSQRGRPPSGELELTQVGEIVGTPSYMAPEQASGKRGVVTVAADIYSLGAILYEMLTGRPPFKGPTRMATVRQVLTERPIPPRQLNPKIDRDLERICLKCLERDPQMRYASAEALAEDLERWLAGEPILAGPTSWWYRTRKWMKRRPTMAALVAATAIVTALGLTGVIWQARLAHWQAERAWLAESALCREREQVRQHHSDRQRLQQIRIVQEAWHHWREGDWQLARQTLSQVLDQHRRWDWYWLDSYLQTAEQPVWQHSQLVGFLPVAQGWLVIGRHGEIWQLPAHPSFSGVSHSTNHSLTTLASASAVVDAIRGVRVFQDGSLVVWNSRKAAAWFDCSTKQPTWSWQGQSQEVLDVILSPQKTQLAVVYQSLKGMWHAAVYPEDAFPQLLSVQTGKPRASSFVGEHHLLLLTDTGQALVWSRANSIWDTTPWQARLATLIEYAAIANNGRFLLAEGNRTFRLGFWQPDWDRVWLDEPQIASANIAAVAMTDDGGSYALALNDGTILLGQVRGQLRRLRLSRPWQARALRFSRGGNELALLTYNGEVLRLPLDLAIRHEASPVGRHDCAKAEKWHWPKELEVSQTVVATSLNKILAATADGQLVLASIPPAPTTEITDYRKLTRFSEKVTALSWCDARRFILVALADGTLHLGRYSPGNSNWVWQSESHSGNIEEVAIAPSGEWFATWDANRRLWVWDAELMVNVMELRILANDCTRLHTSDAGLHLQESSGTWWTWYIPVKRPPS